MVVSNRGQSTIEYILMVAFGAIFSIQVVRIINDAFKEGLVRLEQNVEFDMQTGAGYKR